MKKPSGRGTFFARLVFSMVSGIALAAFAVTAVADKGGIPNEASSSKGGKFTCSIADPGQISEGTPVTFTGSVSGDTPPYTVDWTFTNASPGMVTTPNVQPGDTQASTTFDSAGQQTVSLTATGSAKGNGNGKPKTCTATRQVTVEAPLYGDPTARGDAYGTPAGKTLTVQTSRVSGVLYNDFDTDPTTGENIGNAGLTVDQTTVSTPINGGSVTMNTDGSFSYTPGASLGNNDNDSFTYQSKDADGNLSNVATVNIHIQPDQPDFKIMMNYELGMHCTGFEFSYCCILPPYNSIVAQVVRRQDDQNPFPRLLSGDPSEENRDGLGRETVLRDYDSNGTIHKYYLEYYHDAMPRLEGNMPASDGGHFNSTAGKDTTISAVEGNSMLYWNTPYDSACVNWSDTGKTGACPSFNSDFPEGGLVYGPYANLNNVVQGDGVYTTPTNMGVSGGTDNFQNGWLNHFYIYQDLEGSNPDHTSLEADKIRLGVAGMVEYPPDCGPSLQPMGPVTQGGDPTAAPYPNDCGGASGIPGILPGNVLTFSGDKGTVVYTQMKVLENLPIMLTSPEIWEGLGLPLTPFEDSINFFGEPGAIDEDSIRPFVAMKAQLREYPSGDAVMRGGKPVIGFGSAPIDIPNCERCHSAPAYELDAMGEPDPMQPNVNAPSYVRRQDGPKPYYGPSGETLEAMEQLEINYWKWIYPSLTTGTDWYARLKGAAISIEVMHDYDVGTNFTANYPTSGIGEPFNDTLGLPGYKSGIPQNTRMGHEAIICQKCHADNVIAVVKSAGIDGFLVPPISEAIHRTHAAKSASPPVPAGPLTFDDSKGRYGGCQGCHPAHRSDGVMDNYPISQHGFNNNADGDNRLGGGGCFVGRDVHSNPLKDVDGAETPSHLTAVGQWMLQNVANDSEDYRGIWCTNCHQQFSQEMWRTEDCNDLIHGDCLNNVRGGETNSADLSAVISAVNAGRAALTPPLPPLSEQEVINYLDPKNPAIDPSRTTNQTHAPWSAGIPDANVATIEVSPDGPVVTYDDDGDPSVNILSFCTTPNCVTLINNNKGDESKWRYPESGNVDGVDGFINTDNTAVAVPFSAADDARDHWLAAGEPHCADCHAAPYTEQSGNINPYPPFNYPAKASLNRYTRGHQNISCQSCHESIHGLYPVGAAMDNTTYAQAAALNADGSHGPLKCGTCHAVPDQNDGNGIPLWISPNIGLVSQAIYGQGGDSYDNAVGWAHTYTAEADVLNSTCQNCHGVNYDQGVMSTSKPGDWTKVADHTVGFLTHASSGFVSRQLMDKAEIAVNEAVTGTADGVCTACHGDESDEVSCSNPKWLQHLTLGRVAESVWEQVSVSDAPTHDTCGW